METAFDQYIELCRPLADMEKRELSHTRGDHKIKTCYRAYRLALAEHNITGQVVILVEHGSGREIHSLPSYWITTTPLLSLFQTDEAACYAMLYGLYKMAKNARNKGYDEAMELYNKAFADNRLKKRKRRNSNIVDIWIEKAKTSAA
jgi:hypothetical protein